MKQLKITSQPKKRSQVTEMPSVFQSVGNTECINRDSKLSAEPMNYMTVSKHTWQGRALSL